ncbi:MAG TPA: hypothetical protein V6C72_01025 [Chroococcales cyanobacterium]
MSHYRSKSVIIRRAEEGDFDALVKLQVSNLGANLSADQKTDGFLSAYWDHDKLAQANQNLCVLVCAATDAGEAIGFIGLTTVAFNLDQPLPAEMVRAAEPYLFEGKPLSQWNACICGPVCIERQYRGQGLFEALYDNIPDHVGDCDLAITLVSLANGRSLAAHAKVGLKPIFEFAWNGREFSTLAKQI